MSKVVHIGICKNKGLPIIEVNSIEAVQGKGLIGDRKFKNNNDQKCQLTLIELEKRLKELNQVVVAGRTELGKLQSITSVKFDKSSENQLVVPFKNIRSKVSKLKG